MKIKLIAIGASAIIAIGFFPAQAVEGGVDATGSQFVVPILIQKSPTTTGACSGALIAPYIVVTAGHCVLDSSGLLTTKVYVGLFVFKYLGYQNSNLVNDLTCFPAIFLEIGTLAFLFSAV